MIDAIFDGFLEGAGFVVAADDDQDGPGIHHGADSDGKGGFGDQVDIAIEESGIGDDGIGGEGLYPSATCE